MTNQPAPHHAAQHSETRDEARARIQQEAFAPIQEAIDGLSQRDAVFSVSSPVRRVEHALNAALFAYELPPSESVPLDAYFQPGEMRTFLIDTTQNALQKTLGESVAFVTSANAHGSGQGHESPVEHGSPVELSNRYALEYKVAQLRQAAPFSVHDIAAIAGLYPRYEKLCRSADQSGYATRETFEAFYRQLGGALPTSQALDYATQDPARFFNEQLPALIAKNSRSI